MIRPLTALRLVALLCWLTEPAYSQSAFMQTALIVIEPEQAESKALLSEWNRKDWPLDYVRAICECICRWKVVDRSTLSGVTTVPCVIIGESVYPIRANYSGQAILGVWEAHLDWFEGYGDGKVDNMKAHRLNQDEHDQMRIWTWSRGRREE